MDRADWETFWLETARTAAVGTVAVLFTIYYVDPKALAAKAEEAITGQKIEAQQAVIDDFIKSGHMYAMVTSDVLGAEPHEVTPEDRKRWNDLYDEYTGNAMRMNTYFGGLLDVQEGEVREILKDLRQAREEQKHGSEKIIDWDEKLLRLKVLTKEMAQEALESMGL